MQSAQNSRAKWFVNFSHPVALNIAAMQILLAIAVLIAVAITVWWLSSRLVSTQSQYERLAPKSLGEVNTDPDRPIGFGYKNSWLAIRTTDAAKVLEYLPICDTQRANWASGLDAAYKGHTFVSPPVDGWVFLISRQLPELGHPPHSDQWCRLMTALSRHFDDVQYFATHRVSEFHAWSRYREGIEQRAFAFGDGESIVDRGSKTDDEIVLGYDYFDGQSDQASDDSYWERDDLCFPNEQHVIEVASKWSLNPCTLDELDLPVSTGWIGTLSPEQTV